MLNEAASSLRAGDDRRTVLLDIALRVLAQRGAVGLTHRGVDAAADLPEGSTTYYFPRKAALVAAAMEHCARRLENDDESRRERFASLFAEHDRDTAMELAATDLRDCLIEDRDLLLARIELSLLAARDTGLAAQGRRLADAARRPVAAYLDLLADALGTTSTHAERDLCVGLIDGLMLANASGQAAPPTAEQIAAACKSIVS